MRLNRPLVFTHKISSVLSAAAGRKRRRRETILICAAVAAGSAIASFGAQGAEKGDWITTWAATPAPRWSDDLPAPFGVPEVLENQTIRQVARISVGGNSVRVVLSNAFGEKPLTIGAGSVAIAGKGGEIDQKTLKPLTWGGKSSVVVPPGVPILSDPVALSAEALSEISVSIFLPKKTALSSVHWDGVQTAYISGPGNFTSDAAFKADSTLKSRLFLSDIWVDAAPESEAIVFFGDSITDGNCSTPDANNRWPDHIAKRLQEANRKVAVVNEAFSGNRVLTDGMGVNALARFDSDILSHPKVATVVLMMGINDIGWPGENAITPDDKQPTAQDIITGYKQLIDRAHAHGIRIVGATLTPFAETFKGLPTEGYYTAEKEKIRVAVNQWIRTGDGFDGVIDFDKVMEDPAKPGYLRDDYDCGDNLHPNDAGYKAMADAVDLEILLGPAK
ncbi:MAG: SGNH/GDSL hydrolase family protein [Mesorhizobium sp.]|nr:MAG: SGNH/GDSL hydrolase family protein [Mesorhizobium sp.]RWK53317.1 MAG: SGNH/GDSL hydrolase family protein [Mesorhizobium sp.]RWK98592.1 MAG: SGNH/GDSL hydrolase family protein [Mesorhizobium sp.]TIQ32458.1 MAG: SGNH/GDSL hydrolase family protein [Mesorhizobium sp.]TJW57360.1 MAG: SGNH/GDSL hydrolase family protein [Mesorhizobium sp.]